MESDGVVDGLSVIAFGLVLVALKLAGYLGAGVVIAKTGYPTAKASTLGFALARTLAGFAGGLLLASAAIAVGTVLGNLIPDLGTILAGVGAFAAQVAMRFALSLAVVIFFFDRSRAQLQKDALFAAGLVVWSYVLDVPGYLLGIGELAFLLRDLRIC